jgi:hypothetical protein
MNEFTQDRPGLFRKQATTRFLVRTLAGFNVSPTPGKLKNEKKKEEGKKKSYLSFALVAVNLFEEPSLLGSAHATN